MPDIWLLWITVYVLIPFSVSDVTISPRGELLVAAHSGQPDWGSGPSGKGLLFKIRYAAPKSPQPVVIWPAGPEETRVEFDRPLDESQRAAITRAADALLRNSFAPEAAISITAGRFANAGDQFESLRPGYAVVNNIQQKEPRFDVPLSKVKLSEDGRTLTIVSVPRDAAMQYVLSLPWNPSPAGKGALRQLPLVELAHDLSGVEAKWESADQRERWTGWLPHADLEVAAELTRGSATHDTLWAMLRRPGTLRLAGQFDLWQMLHPAVQPGSKLDYVPPVEVVTLDWRGSASLTLTTASVDAKVERKSGASARLTVPARRRWTPIELSLQTGGDAPAQLRVAWHTNEDSRERAVPLRRFLLPWVTPLQMTNEQKDVPELAGGDFKAGRDLFFGQSIGCARCHTIRGDGGKVAPDLSNLIHRDYASVLKDIRQPSATINPDYLNYIITLNDGEPLSGIVVGASDKEIRLGSPGGAIAVVPRSTIESMSTSKVSMMPEGLLDALSPQQIKDLMTFLLTEPPAGKHEP